VEVEPGCPKRMVYGPCGGVRPDLRCEVAEHRCPFTERPVVAWDGAQPSPTPRPELLGRRPLVLPDLTVPPYDAAAVRQVTARLAPVSDVLLLGEHSNRPDLPPALLASLVLDAGGQPLVTLSCRDRNRVVLEQELHGLAAIGAAGVLCVTGDARGPGVRPGATQVFDLDGTRLAHLAAETGLLTAVPEAPGAPPEPLRAARLREKERAGADLCVLNHVRSPELLAAFVADARALGCTLPFVAGVAVYTDQRSAEVLLRFPGLDLDPEAVATVLAAPDPVEAGIAAAVAEARALLAVPGVVGVNLSGLASDRGFGEAAVVKAEVARRVRQA
jgi:5,10-methylenetetrahydrofolate reductase